MYVLKQRIRGATGSVVKCGIGRIQRSSYSGLSMREDCGHTVFTVLLAEGG